MRLLISYRVINRFHLKELESQRWMCIDFWKDEVKELILGKHSVTGSCWRLYETYWFFWISLGNRVWIWARKRLIESYSGSREYWRNLILDIVFSCVNWERKPYMWKLNMREIKDGETNEDMCVKKQTIIKVCYRLFASGYFYAIWFNYSTPLKIKSNILLKQTSRQFVLFPTQTTKTKRVFKRLKKMKEVF